MILVTDFGAPGSAIQVDLAAGDLLLVTGPNGCGKTSLLRTMAGLPAWLPTGSVRIAGGDPSALPASELARRVAYVPQRAIDGLVGLTNQGEFRLRAKPWPGRAVQEVDTLSEGEARQLALDTATAPPLPPALLLDEPFNGLDEAAAVALAGSIAGWADAGHAVVVADHTGRLESAATRRLALAGPGDDSAPDYAALASGLAGGVGDLGLTAPPLTPVLHTLAPATVQFPGRSVSVPAHDLRPGLTAVTGANGAGKTTVLGAWHGQIQAAGHAAFFLTTRTRWHLRAPTVAACLADCSIAVADALVGPGLRQRHPWSLSGGEAKRVALARALGGPHEIVLLDEPEVGLDRDARRALAQLLRDHSADRAIVLATHDPQLMDAASSRVEVSA